jgi:putative SOS response-associated peptidase YedK
MCGRFTLTNPNQDLLVQFTLRDMPALEPRYNIAPTQPVAAVRVAPALAALPPVAAKEAALRSEGREGSARELVLLHWGLVPFWAKDPQIGSRLINARSETVAEKPAFREAFRRRRCLVLADGFYEWQKQGGTKQPFCVRLRDGRPFAFAGLWEHWQGTDAVVESCTLLTTDPNELMRPLHNRMPVIIDPGDYELWLDVGVRQPDVLQSLLRPYPAEEMEAYPVSRRVNSPDNDDPQCVEPLPHGEGTPFSGF